MQTDNGPKTCLTETLCVPVLGRYDVIVIGGGIAGVSAALAAARQGAKTLLVEKQSSLGGLATGGQIVIFLPLCDGRGQRLMGGIPLELLQTAVKCGKSTLPAEWAAFPLRADTEQRCQSVFNGPAFAYALEELLLQSRVHLLLDTLLCGVATDERSGGRAVSHVIVENKSGRAAYACAAAVDATGDADLFARAGEPCETKDNALAYWSYCKPAADRDEDGFTEFDRRDGVRMLAIGDHLGNGLPQGAKGRYDGTNARDVTRFLTDSHAMALAYVRAHPGAQLLSIPTMAQFRMTRRIVGRYTLTEQDVGKAFDDSVGVIGDWRAAGRTLHLPYRALYGGLANVLAAGRIISSDGDAWEITRVIPAASLSGQAAGTAAALIAGGGVGCSSVDVALLRSRLADAGAIAG